MKQNRDFMILRPSLSNNGNGVRLNIKYKQSVGSNYSSSSILFQSIIRIAIRPILQMRLPENINSFNQSWLPNFVRD